MKQNKDFDNSLEFHRDLAIMRQEEIEKLRAENLQMREALEKIVDDPGFPIENNEAAIALRSNLIAHKALARLRQKESK